VETQEISQEFGCASHKVERLRRAMSTRRRNASKIQEAEGLVRSKP
jgi:hypothetical protein